jgi:DNA mismatch repair protein MutH
MSNYIEVDGLRVDPCMWRSKVEEVEQLRARVAELCDLIKYAQVKSGACMCGDNMQDHNQYSGHSPVDVWDHAVEQINKEGSSEAFILRKQAEAVDVAASFYCAVMETEDLAREIRRYRGQLAREADDAENAGGL